MRAPPTPHDEARRLAALRQLKVLDSGAEPEFDALASAAALATGRPIALVSLVDAHRQWFKANIGLAGVAETPRDLAFCAHAILHDEILEVPDALVDERFRDNPLVTGAPGIRFYAGAPLCAADGSKIGTLCVIDHAPGRLDDAQRQILGHLARAASEALESRLAKLELAVSEARLLRVGEVAGVGGWELDCATGEIGWSDQTFRIHGLEPGTTPAVAEAIDFYTPEARPLIRAALERCMRQGLGYDLELPLQPRGGRRIWVRAVGSAVVEDGRVVRVTGAFQDITESRQLRDKLAREHELLRLTLESIGDAVITINAQGRVEWLNPAAERITGWSAADARGLPLPQVFHIVHEETRRPASYPVAACLERGQTVRLPEKTVLISRSGVEYRIEDSVAPIRATDGGLLGAVLVLHDVTEQRRMAREMMHRATHDSLTGLCNRAAFETRLEQLVPVREGAAVSHALLYIDLDQFKIVNDSCGHGQGDRLLQRISDFLRQRLRASDLVARLGGDEFAVILEGCPPEYAESIATDICEAMDEFRFVHAERSFHVGMSIGLVMIDPRWGSAAAVLQAADSACYAAKDVGRNRVHVWTESDTTLSERRGDTQWATRLEQALGKDQLELYAQRIEPLHGEPACGIFAEVLLRLRDGRGGVVTPSAFMPAAERFHMSTRIDRYVLRQSLAWLARIPDLGRIDTLAINLSGRSVEDPRFHAFVIGLLDTVGHDLCRRVCLEITETVALSNLVQVAGFVDQVRRLGVRVALDDFGAGAASFGYLKAIPVDLLKIDGQFIRDLVDDPLDAAAVRSIAEVARVMGVKTVAECVERPETAEELRNIGIDYIQGFLRHRPEPIDALVAPEPQAAYTSASAAAV